MGCGDEKDNRGTTELSCANDVSAGYGSSSGISMWVNRHSTPTKPPGNAVRASPKVKYAPQVRVPCATSGQERWQ